MILDLRDILRDGSLNHLPVTAEDLDARADPDASPLVIALLSLDDDDREEAISALWSWARARRDVHLICNGRLAEIPPEIFEITEQDLRARAASCPALKPLCRMVKL